MKNKLLSGFLLLALVATFTVSIAVSFAASEKRMDTTANLWRDLVQSNPSSNIMFGSSTIRKFDANKLLECGSWENRGIGTAGITTKARYLSWPFKKWSPEWIIVYAGDNDVARDGLDSAETISLHKEFTKSLSERYPESTLMLLEIKPSPKRAAHHSTYRTINTYLEEYADQNENAIFVASDWDEVISTEKKNVFLDDGVHLNELGNQIMATRINEACKSQ